jgi:hypothetical protein
MNDRPLGFSMSMTTARRLSPNRRCSRAELPYARKDTEIGEKSENGAIEKKKVYFNAVRNLFRSYRLPGNWRVFGLTHERGD